MPKLQILVYAIEIRILKLISAKYLYYSRIKIELQKLMLLILLESHLKTQKFEFGALDLV